MRVILHIGWRKTGTSAIQYLLYSNRELLRRQYSIHYPDAGLFGRAHHLPGWKLLGQRAPGSGRPSRKGRVVREGGFEDMLKETADSGCKQMLVSTEVLSQGEPSLPARLAEIFQGHVVEIIAYVRRQDRYIEARHNQRVKDGRLKSGLAQFAGDQVARNTLDYHEYFARWAAAFARESLKIRLYERGAFRQGDVRLDFLDAIGIEERGLSFEEGLRNVSLDFAGIQFLQRLDAIPNAGIHRRHLVRLLGLYAEKNPDSHSSLLTPDERLSIMEHYRESNRRFAKEFLGRDDEVFEIPESELAAEARLDREYGEEQFLDMLAFVLPRLLSTGRKAKRGPRKKMKKAARRAARSQVPSPKT